MEPFFANIVLGIVQGVTEFLPISSSGHLVLIQSLFKTLSYGIFEDLVFHGGTLLAVLIYYRNNLLSLAKSPFTKEKEKLSELFFLIVATAITALLVLPLRKPIEELFTKPEQLGIPWLVTSLLLFLAHLSMKRKEKKGDMTFLSAILVGIAQAFATIPGISRSGATVTVAILSGISPKKAGEFSFLLSIPAIAGSLLIEGYTHLPKGELSIPLLFGFLSAFFSGFLSLHLFLHFLTRGTLLPFAIYCLFLGAGVVTFAIF